MQRVCHAGQLADKAYACNNMKQASIFGRPCFVRDMLIPNWHCIHEKCQQMRPFSQLWIGGSGADGRNASYRHSNLPSLTVFWMDVWGECNSLKGHIQWPFGHCLAKDEIHHAVSYELCSDANGGGK
eukprot:scaffold74366_cov18-Prasinocladus_malaysianus.AAC.1